jgi:hypothetical protein
MISVKRNQQLAELAAEVRQNTDLKAALQSQDYFIAACEPFIQKLDAFLKNFSGLAWGAEICFSDRSKTINLKKSVEFNPAENIQHKFDKPIGGMS